MTKSEKVQIVLDGVVKCYCPSDFGLKDISNCKCKSGKKPPCKLCWKKALEDD